MTRILFALSETIEKIKKDDLTGYAAQSCYYLILAFFPFVALLLSLIKYLPVEYSTFINLINDIVPVYFKNDAINLFNDMYNSSTITLTGVSAIGTLWASGKGLMSIMKGFNVIYEIEEKRNFFIIRCISSFQTLVFILAILIMLVFVVFGNAFISFTAIFFPYIAFVLQALTQKRVIIFPLFLTLVFMFMYKLIPSRKSSLIRQLPGSVLAALAWYAFSIFFSVYVSQTSYKSMFGGLGTLILVLIWIYADMLIIFYGAEVNVLIEKGIIKPLLMGKRK